MKTKYIKIITLDELSDFVSRASKVNGNVMVSRGKFCVDGKSILGMMFINSSEGCRIEYPESAVEFEDYIAQFELPH